MDQRRRTPKGVAWLGYSGTLPFLGIAVAMWAVPGWQSWLQPALLDYAALVLSFLGALHAGMAIAGIGGQDTLLERRMHLWSVAPCLIGWLALLLPLSSGTVLLVGGLVAQWVQDLRLARRAELPRWYLGLRTRLSLVACLSLLAAAVAVPFAYGAA
jgi:hypothetical protein